MQAVFASKKSNYFLIGRPTDTVLILFAKKVNIYLYLLILLIFLHRRI
jgi:hypothetical protein